jgi:hypothetical protein
MRIYRYVSTATLSLLGLLAIAQSAGAIPLPDNSSCTTTPCLKISETDTRTGVPTIAIMGDTTASNTFTSKAIFGNSTVGYGVVGNSNSGTGVSGVSSSGRGMLGNSTTGNGVEGNTSSANGVQGSSGSTGGNGVYGFNTSTAGNGVLGHTNLGGIAIYGDNTDSAVGWAGLFNGDVSARSYTSTSDARLKKDVKDLNLSIDQLMRFRPVSYKWIKESDGKGEQLGLVAQEVQKILPGVVRADGATGMLSINYTALIPIMIKAAQDQQKVVARLESKVTALEAEKATLRSSFFSGPFGEGFALGWLPLAAIVAFRRRKQADDRRGSA